MNIRFAGRPASVRSLLTAGDAFTTLPASCVDHNSAPSVIRNAATVASETAITAPSRPSITGEDQLSSPSGGSHAVQSRSLAEAVLSAIELRGLGPTRLRERLPVSLLGVNAPGILLECGTLTSREDRERVTNPEGMRQLAMTIAEGVAAYRRNE